MPKFAIIPAAALLDMRIGASELRVYAALSLHATKSRSCSITHARIAEICGFSEKSVKYVSVCIRKLAEYGYVIIKHQGFKRPNIYSLVDVTATDDNENLRTVTNRRLPDEVYKERNEAQRKNYLEKHEPYEIAQETAARNADSQTRGYSSHSAELDEKARKKGFLSYAEELDFRNKRGVYADPLTYAVTYYEMYGHDYVPYEDPCSKRLRELEATADAVSGAVEFKADAEFVGDYSNEFMGE